jgi:hypothetical protein
LSARTYNNQFEIELKTLIEEEVARVSENVLLGSGVVTLERYREQVGYLRALRKAAELCDQAADILEKR